MKKWCSAGREEDGHYYRLRFGFIVALNSTLLLILSIQERERSKHVGWLPLAKKEKLWNLDLGPCLLFFLSG